MSKSARDERPWGFKGKQVLGPPVTEADLLAHIVDGCRCLGCEDNRNWIGKYYGTKREVHEPVPVLDAEIRDVVEEDQVHPVSSPTLQPVLAAHIRRDEQADLFL